MPDASGCGRGLAVAGHTEGELIVVDPKLKSIEPDVEVRAAGEACTRALCAFDEERPACGVRLVEVPACGQVGGCPAESRQERVKTSLDGPSMLVSAAYLVTERVNFRHDPPSSRSMRITRCSVPTFCTMRAFVRALALRRTIS